MLTVILRPVQTHNLDKNTYQCRIHTHRSCVYLWVCTFTLRLPVGQAVLTCSQISFHTAKTLMLSLTPLVLWEVHTKLILISTPVGVSLILLGVKFNTGWCESGIKLTPTGVEINTNLVWTSHNTGDVKFNTRVFASIIVLNLQCTKISTFIDNY